MTTATGEPPTHNTPADRARGFLTAGVVGAALTAFIGGIIAERIPLVVTGLALLPAYGLLFLLMTAPRRARRAAIAPVTALAMIESLEAVDHEGSDVPVRFDLTVAPDEARGFRVEIRQSINLVELSDYRPRGIVVFEYPPDRPWRGRIVKRPTPAWEERARAAGLDSVPGPAMKDDSAASCAGCLLSLLGVLVGAGIILGLFHSEIFDSTKSDAADTPTVTSTDSSSTTTTTTTNTITTTVTSDLGTVTLDPSRSMLDPGELRTSVESLTQDGSDRKALTVVVQNSKLTVVFAPDAVKSVGFDPASLPYDRIPALVQQAEHSPRVGTVRSWQLTAVGATGSPTLTVVATGDKGSATLIADAKGKVKEGT